MKRRMCAEVRFARRPKASIGRSGARRHPPQNHWSQGAQRSFPRLSAVEATT
eukprot:CAMPEP_0115103748 /NCGR_PEP_ID=MMETSP0227-20121206/34815_1 /TAXON_ID=89957 /ORGANISM="Polarella glacialis, Strain CCMP 1383" /LENGTH=51 /DNA_ID=CAMNT_0002500355 /DNA_START=204 /DNA_END=356 /DNA_ORIENTATION=-